MTVPSCNRCGQLLLPEIVRELGAGRRCPFCNAELKLDPEAKLGRGAPVSRPPPPAPPARAKVPPAPPTPLGASAARMRPAAAPAVMVTPSAPRSNTAPALALSRAPQPDTAPNLVSVPAPGPRQAEPVLEQPQPLSFALQPSDAERSWVAALRRRRWPAVATLLAVIVTIGVLAGRHRPIATTGELSAPGPTAVAPPMAALPSVTPLPPAPPAEDRDVPKNPEPAAATHAKQGGRSHGAQRTHKKRRAAHPSRSKHNRLVARPSTAAPKGSEDEQSARASYERGNQRLLTGDTAAAISAYQEAVRSAPSSASGYRGLGLAYEKEGKIAEAVRAFRRYLELAPSSGDRDLVSRRLRHLLRAGDRPGK